MNEADSLDDSAREEKLNLARKAESQVHAQGTGKDDWRLWRTVVTGFDTAVVTVSVFFVEGVGFGMELIGLIKLNAGQA